MGKKKSHKGSSGIRCGNENDETYCAAFSKRGNFFLLSGGLSRDKNTSRRRSGRTSDSIFPSSGSSGFRRRACPPAVREKDGKAWASRPLAIQFFEEEDGREVPARRFADQTFERVGGSGADVERGTDADFQIRAEARNGRAHFVHAEHALHILTFRLSDVDGHQVPAGVEHEGVPEAHANQVVGVPEQTDFSGFVRANVPFVVNIPALTLIFQTESLRRVVGVRAGNENLRGSARPP